MTAMAERQLQAAVDELLEDGFELAQEGAIVRPPAVGVSFADRADGFRIGLLGYSGRHSSYENRLFDSDTRWVHLRRPKR